VNSERGELVTIGDERPHKKLEVWQEAMALVARIYNLTKEFPKSEAYGLSSQMRRSAISIPSNIAEGAARKSKAEFLQFLNIAQGSLSELDTQLELAYVLGYIDEKRQKETLAKLTTIFRMLSGLIRSLKKSE
jgi:four helix bundle protein